jgi:hypothetical protein
MRGEERRGEVVEEEETYSQGDDGSSTANHRQRLDPGSDDRRQEDLWRRGEERRGVGFCSHAVGVVSGG